MAASSTITKLQSWVQNEMAVRHIPGMAVGVYRGGKPVEIVTAGYADLENKVRVRRQTQFPICSITKQFTAAAVLLLVQDGKMRLDDPVGHYVDGIPSSWSGVTIRRLLQHSSGVPDRMFRDDLPEMPLREAIVKLRKHPLDYQPGDQWSYNNTGYWLLGVAIEKVSGQSFFDFLHDRIFVPLGLAHTFPNRAKELVPWRARGYAFKNGRYYNAPRLIDSVGTAAGGLISTLDDLNIWSKALASGKLLSAESRKEMLTPAVLNSGDRAWNFAGGGYGLGVFIDTLKGHVIEKHSGGWDDASCQLTRFLDNGLTVIVLTNVGNYEQRSFVGERIGKLFDGSILVPAWKSRGAAEPLCSKRVFAAVSNVAAGRSAGDTCTAACKESILSSIEEIHGLTQGKDVSDWRFVNQISQRPNVVYLFAARFRDRVIIQATMTADNKIAQLKFLEPPAS